MFGNKKKKRKVLRLLDDAADNFQFPMLDNGNLYLAASRLSVFCNVRDWAFVFEIFGFSPRAGQPDLSVQTIASSVENRNPRSNYASDEAYNNYLKHNQNYEFRSFFPIENDDWIDEENPELVALSGEVIIRGKSIPLPSNPEYEAAGIRLEFDRPAVHELCRLLAEQHRELLLASQTERKTNLPNSLPHLITLDDWQHPDLANGQKPSEVATFSKLANVVQTGDPNKFSIGEAGNTNWRNWPEGGLL